MRAAMQFALVSVLVGGFLAWSAFAPCHAEASRADAAFGFASTFGAAAAAWSGDASALYANPAALSQARRRALWTLAGRGEGCKSTRAGATMPTLGGTVFGLGYAQSRVEAPANGLGSQRRRIHVGAARLLTRGWSAGTNVQLLSQKDGDAKDTSFGLDLGTHWAWSPQRGRVTPPVVRAGMMVLNAVEPRVTLGAEEVHETRTWTAGLGWTAWRRGAWATTLASGIEARADARRALSYVALAEAPHGVQLAVGVHDARLRAGVSASRGAWTWGYAYTDAPDGAAHGINLQLRFGLQTRTRRARERSERELEFASRFASMTEERDAAQLLQWRREAQQAFARGQFARAAALYQVVLETRPGDVRAADGLLQSRHASMVREADSLLQERDPAGALRALEKAIALAPYDSVSVQRLSQLRLAARDASRTRSAVSRHFNAGIEAYARQNYRDAVTEFDAVLKLDPQHAQATSYREQAMNSHDMRVRSALNQARTRLDADDFAGARSHLRRALDLEPGHSEARRLTARIEGAAKAAQREAERRTQEAEVAVVQPEDGAPVVPVAEVRKRYDSGMQEYRSGNLMTAMQTWEEVAELAPHFEEVDKYLLRIYRVTGLESYTEGRLRDAVDIWEKALLLEPENAQLRRYLNRAHAKLARAQSVDSGR